MSNIVIAFSKPEVAVGIKKILTQSGYSVQAVCTTGAQALASVNNLECGILICGCRFMDMMYMEIHDYLPPEFQMLLITSPSSIQEREVSNLVCLSMPMKVHELGGRYPEAQKEKAAAAETPFAGGSADHSQGKGTPYGTKLFYGRGST